MSEIICRLDTISRTPVVFVADSYNEGKREIMAWKTGPMLEPMPVSFYHGTGPLSQSDEQILARRYMEATGATDVSVRHRLPRKRRVIDSIFQQPEQMSVEGGNKQSAGQTVVTSAVREPKRQSGNGADTSINFQAAIEAVEKEMNGKIEALKRALASSKK